VGSLPFQQWGKGDLASDLEVLEMDHEGRSCPLRKRKREVGHGVKPAARRIAYAVAESFHVVEEPPVVEFLLVVVG
jgi:hypothetical protein